MKDRIRLIKESDFETLTITGFIDPAICTVLRRVRRKLQEMHPNIVIKYTISTYQTSFEILRRGEADLAIEPISSLIDIHDLENVALLAEPTVVVIETDSPLAALTELTDESFHEAVFTSLRSNKDHATRKHLQELAKQRGYAGDIPRGLRLSQVDSYEELFLSGLEGALLMLPETKAEEYCMSNRDDFKVIPFPGKENDYDFRVFYSVRPSAKVQKFLEALEQAQKEARLPSNA